MSDYSDMDRPEFIRVTRRTARRPWLCAGCKAERPAGTQYEYMVCKMPGEPMEASKRCLLDINYDCPFDGVPDHAPKPQKCSECGTNWADPPSTLCPGCEAYREHTR